MEYWRKCWFCGERHKQEDMIRTDYSPNGWCCENCWPDVYFKFNIEGVYFDGNGN